MDLLDKIQALFNHAEGTDIEIERAAFLAKANELIEKYQISFRQIDSSANGMKPQIMIKRVILANKSVTYKWKLYLITSISRMCFTHVLISGRTALIVGHSNNIDTTIIIYDRILQDLLIQVEIDYMAAKLAGDMHIAPLAWKNTYLTIAVTVIDNRIAELTHTREKAIVIINQDEIDDHIQATFGIIRTSRDSRLIQTSPSALTAGTNAGSEARIMEELK